MMDLLFKQVNDARSRLSRWKANLNFAHTSWEKGICNKEILEISKEMAFWEYQIELNNKYGTKDNRGDNCQL